MTDQWWRNTVMYQVYPRSYKDTNGDGVGDLKGITDRMDYIASLGIGGIWLSPCFKSPMKDFGYDISDYCDIDPMFGTLDDFDAMLKAAHDRGIKIIIDQVYSHTSTEHPWFQESKKSRENPKSDWYVWADPNPQNPDHLPNNWRALFGGPAWTWCEKRGQFYMHNFLKEQPDLNFHNPDVQDAILRTAEFWLKRGVDGFRLDVINFCFHNKSLQDNPPKEDLSSFATQLEIEDDPYNTQEHKYDKSQPEMFDFLRRLRVLADAYRGTMLLGEIGDDDPVKLAAEYTSGNDKLHTAYNFSLMAGAKKELTAAYIKEALTEHLDQPGDSWPSWAFSNHDVVRSVTRFGKGDHPSAAQAKLLVALLCSLRGTAFLYQGEELGLPEARIPEDIPVESMQDPWGIALYPKAPGRDGCRTPMPWEHNRNNAGFSDAEPWLPVPESHREMSVDVQEKDQHSTLNFTRTFLEWRKSQPLLSTGDIRFLDTGCDRVLGFVRENDQERILCLFNLSSQEKKIALQNVEKTHSMFGFKGVTGIYEAEKGAVILPPYGMFFGC